MHNIELFSQLRILRKSLRLTQEEFGKKIAKSKNTIINWENRNTEPPGEIIEVLQYVFNANPNWLRTNQGQMLLPAGYVKKIRSAKEQKSGVYKYKEEPKLMFQETTTTPVIEELNGKFYEIPIYKPTINRESQDKVDFEQVSSTIIKKEDYKPQLIYLKVFDDSMEKLINQDSVIIIDTSQFSLLDKKIYCFKTPGSGLITRTVNMEIDALVLEPYNKHYDRREIEWANFDPTIIYGRVVGSLNNIFR